MSCPLLRKDEAQPLPDQISAILRQRIACGEYQPGKKLKTIRQYANEFAVSPVTVIKALDILEEETLIKRVPIKGVFVSDRLSKKNKILKACFAFPEKELIDKPYTTENWCLNFELLQGLFCGSRQYDVDMQFTYFEDNPTPELLEKQKSALQEFDFVIFAGYQLHLLQEESAKVRPTFDISSGNPESASGIVMIDYDREQMHAELARYLVNSGCRSAAAVISSDRLGHCKKIRSFIENARSAGITLPGGGIWSFDLDAPDLQQRIKEHLCRREAEFIFVETTDLMPEIYEAAFDLDLMPGKDFIVTGIASGLTFTRLFPRLSYFRIPRFDMGMQIMEYASKLLRTGGTSKDIKPLKVEFIAGKDLRKNKTKGAKK